MFHPLLLILTVTANAEGIDKVVAIVGNDIILQSEVEIERLLNPFDNTASAIWIHHEFGPLERLVMSAQLRTSAGSIALYQPTDSSVRARVTSIRTTMGDSQYEEFCRVTGLDNMVLTTIIKRRMVAEKFAARNINSDTANLEQWDHQLEMMLIGLREKISVRYTN